MNSVARSAFCPRINAPCWCWCYAGPDDDAIAAHLGCRVGSVRTHASRRLARLRGAMHLLTNGPTGRPTGRPEES